jgi:hypothetical protein
VNVQGAVTDPLQMLGEAIRAQNIARYIEVVSGAKIPIVKFDHVSGVSVDILCNNSDGLVTARLMKKYVREFPPLKPLTVLLKVFLVGRLSHLPALSSPQSTPESEEIERNLYRRCWLFRAVCLDRVLSPGELPPSPPYPPALPCPNGYPR